MQTFASVAEFHFEDALFMSQSLTLAAFEVPSSSALGRSVQFSLVFPVSDWNIYGGSVK